MASIKEAFDITLKEAFAGIKIMAWAVPISIGFASVYGNGMFGVAMGNTLLVVTLFLFFGLCVTVAHNVCIRKDTIIPSFNFVGMFINGALAIVSILPSLIISGLLYWGAQALYDTYYPQIAQSAFNAEHPQMVSVFTLTVVQLVILLLLSLPVSGLAVFIRRLNVLEALNFKKFYIAIGETFLSMTTFTIRFVLLAAIVFGFVFYLFYLFVGFNNSFWIYLLVLIGIIYLLMFFNAIAQISDDVFIFAEKEEQKRKEEERIQKLIKNHK